jgi:hypothetical protein
MQIYEVFGLGAIKNAIGDYGAKANARAAQRQQGEYAASAAKSAEKLRRQGYGQSTPDLTVNQLISQVQNDLAAQQLINTWTSQWPELAAKIPLANSQGQVTEQHSNSPDPAYRAAFKTWANDVVEKTVRMPNVVSRMTNNSDWAAKFNAALDQVEATISNTQQHTQAVKNYLTLAVAAARANSQDSAPANRSSVASGLNDPQADALAKTLGIDATTLTKLNAFIRQKGETVNPQGTGSDSLDALLRAAKLLK